MWRESLAGAALILDLFEKAEYGGVATFGARPARIWVGVVSIAAGAASAVMVFPAVTQNWAGLFGVALGMMLGAGAFTAVSGLSSDRLSVLLRRVDRASALAQFISRLSLALGCLFLTAVSVASVNITQIASDSQLLAVSLLTGLLWVVWWMMRLQVVHVGVTALRARVRYTVGDRWATLGALVALVAELFFVMALTMDLAQAVAVASVVLTVVVPIAGAQLHALRALHSEIELLVKRLDVVRSHALRCVETGVADHSFSAAVRDLHVGMAELPGATRTLRASSGLAEFARIIDERWSGITGGRYLLRGHRRRSLARRIMGMPDETLCGAVALVMDRMLRQVSRSLNAGGELPPDDLWAAMRRAVAVRDRDLFRLSSRTEVWGSTAASARQRKGMELEDMH